MSIPGADHRGRAQHRDERGLAAPRALQHGLDGEEVTDEAVAGRLVRARERVGVVDHGTVGPRAVHDGGPDRHDVPGTDGPRRAAGRAACARRRPASRSRRPLTGDGDEVAGVRDEHHDAGAGERVLRALAPGSSSTVRTSPAPRGGDRGRDGSAADDDDLVGRLACRCRVRRPVDGPPPSRAAP